MEQEKVKAVLNWPTPKEVKDVQKFLGLANHHRQFVKDFAFIAKPLHNLVKKEQKWEQRLRQEKFFKVLKRQFTMKPILIALDLNKNIRIKVDMLDYAIGRVLSIEYRDEQ